MRIVRRVVCGAAAAVVLAFLIGGCSKSPANRDSAFNGWPGRMDFEGMRPPRHPAPPSLALVCPGARNATAWLADGTFWNGDVELAFFDGEGKPFDFPVRHVKAPGIPAYKSMAKLSVSAAHVVAFSPWRSTSEDTAGWAWIALEFRNGSGTPRNVQFQVSVRSGGGDGRYIDPRAAHADSFTYRADGDRVLRDGRVVAIYDPQTGAKPAANEADGERAPYDRYEARRTYAVTVPAKQTVRLRFALAPLGGHAPRSMPPGWGQDASDVLDRTVANWKAELAKGASYRFPDELWSSVFDAARGLLVTDYERHGEQRSPLGNPLQYRDFYLRDGARVVRALDLLGRHDLAVEGLGLLYQFQWPPGAFLSQRGQLDGTGQALWALQQHVALTGDEDALRKHGDAALKGATWVATMRLATRDIGGPAAGLMSYSDPRDNEFIRGHLLGTDAWSVLALDVAADLAARMGRDASPWRTEAAAYRQTLITVWDREARRQGRPLPPAIERGGRDWGNLSAVYPCGVLDAGDARVRALDDWLHRTQYTEGLMTFASRDSIHHYVSFDMTQARLRRGDRAGTLEDVTAYLDHTLPDGTGWEFRHRQGTGYGDNLPPHGTFAAMWIDLARACVLYERGESLVLLSGIPESWFTPNAAGLAIERAPTTFGPAAITTKAAGGALDIDLDLPAPARVVLPPGFRAEPVRGAAGRVEGSTIIVPKGKGTWRVARSAG